ncbi:MAG: substrate-binding domain-containing protein [Faecalibacterium sp.]|jgi:raffinose/stachyose/melibiose transport system substrate-binding protein|nr:substrate-binding domain-containing protein [Faecalibacterium sp.]
MKKISRRSFLQVCTAAAAVGVLSACGSSTAAPAASASAASAGSAAAAALSGELELFSTKAENVETLQGLVDTFTAANPGVKITVNSPADAGTVLRSRLTKNDLPDLMFIGGDATYTELVSGGVLMDLSSEDFASAVQENYMQMLYDVNPEKETTPYAIPYATNGSGVLYNKDIFDQVGVSIPTTWTEFQDVIAKISAAGINPIEFTFVDAWTTLPSWNSMAPVIPAADFTDKRKAGEATFVGTHEEVLEKYLTLLKACKNDYMGTSYDDGNKAFAQGEAAMMVQGNWAISEFLKTTPDMNVDLFAFPSTDDATKNTVTSGIDVAMAISATTASPDAAKAFLAFMTEQANAKQYITEQFAFSAITGVDQDDPKVAGVKETIAAGRVSNFPDHYYPSGFDLSAILSQFALNFSDGMDDKENIQTTLESCDTEYDAVNV